MQKKLLKTIQMDGKPSVWRYLPVTVLKKVEIFRYDGFIIKPPDG